MTLCIAWMYLFIQGDVERKAKFVCEFDFVGEQMADLFGCRCRVDRQADSTSVHQRHRDNYRLFGLCCL